MQLLPIINTECIKSLSRNGLIMMNEMLTKDSLKRSFEVINTLRVHVRMMRKQSTKREKARERVNHITPHGFLTPIFL